MSYGDHSVGLALIFVFANDARVHAIDLAYIKRSEAYDQVEAYRQQFDHYLSKFRTLNQLEALTKVPKVAIALVGYLLISVSVFFNIYANFTTGAIAVVYPSYRLLEAIQKKDLDGVSTFGFYFALIAAVNTVEIILLDALLAYIPYYYVAKLVGICWLFFPGYLGSKHVYALVAPQFAAFIEEPKKQ
ncbi:ER membrane protein DP1/Yop1 [Phlyctochytrium planicorne]|nr:ER membrane protein DP1/Yop1 [Phlyctochytrium planicorne]